MAAIPSVCALALAPYTIPGCASRVFVTNIVPFGHALFIAFIGKVATAPHDKLRHCSRPILRRSSRHRGTYKDTISTHFRKLSFAAARFAALLLVIEASESGVLKRIDQSHRETFSSACRWDHVGDEAQSVGKERLRINAKDNRPQSVAGVSEPRNSCEGSCSTLASQSTGKGSCRPAHIGGMASSPFTPPSSSSIADVYRYVSSLRDPRTRGWGGVADTKFVLPLLVGYVYFANVAGPRWMKGRQPFDLRWAVLTYNALTVAANAYFAVRVFRSAYLTGKYSFFCQGIDYGSSSEADVAVLGLAWWYSFVRIADFVDTVFFVLRKKFSQVSFLHIVHHFLVVLSAWFYMHFGADGQPMLGLCVNAVVHVFMYAYYFLAALGPSVRKYLWWKRYITQLQIAQFVGLLMHMAITLFHDCGYPRPLAIIALLQGGFVLGLFINFYIGSYIRQNKAKIRRDGTLKRD